MAGTKEGGKKAAATNKAKYGDDFYREMGHKAYLNDAPYYERVGLHYTIPKLANLKLGINVKAHKGKADFTEIVFGMPIKIKRL